MNDRTGRVVGCLGLAYLALQFHSVLCGIGAAWLFWCVLEGEDGL